MEQNATETPHYDTVAAALEFLKNNYRRQPELDEIARAVHLSPFHFQRIFTAWAGVSPKKFMQFLPRTRQTLARFQKPTPQYRERWNRFFRHKSPAWPFRRHRRHDAGRVPKRRWKPNDCVQFQRLSLWSLRRGFDADGHLQLIFFKTSCVCGCRWNLLDDAKTTQCYGRKVLWCKFFLKKYWQNVDDFLATYWKSKL